MVRRPEPVQLLVAALVAGLGVAVGVTARSATAADPVSVVVPGGVTAQAGVTAPGGQGVGADGTGASGSGAASTGATTSPGAVTSGAPSQPSSVHAAADWVARVAAATGIPPRALQAYGDATLVTAADDPGCRLGWTTLAAIGDVESGHGTHGGAVLGTDGRPDVAILGPALDGSGGVAAVPADADSARWTGDRVWAHAVGPMQFLPSTWRRYGVDADGDGVADPQDVDDASLAAARYLCAAGGDLATASGWTAAVLAYNHSDSYLATVLAVADRYAAEAS